MGVSLARYARKVKRQMPWLAELTDLAKVPGRDYPMGGPIV